MTAASIQSFQQLEPTAEQITVDLVVEWVKDYGPATMHDLYDLLRAGGVIKRTGDGATPSEVEQGWNEFVSRIGQAAKEGRLDDDETVRVTLPSGRKSTRTLYKYLKTPREPRLTRTEELEKLLEMVNERNEFLEQENHRLRKQLGLLPATNKLGLLPATNKEQ